MQKRKCTIGLFSRDFHFYPSDSSRVKWLCLNGVLIPQATVNVMQRKKSLKYTYLACMNCRVNHNPLFHRLKVVISTCTGLNSTIIGSRLRIKKPRWLAGFFILLSCINKINRYTFHNCPDCRASMQ